MAHFTPRISARGCRGWRKWVMIQARPKGAREQEGSDGLGVSSDPDRAASQGSVYPRGASCRPSSSVGVQAWRSAATAGKLIARRPIYGQTAEHGISPTDFLS